MLLALRRSRGIAGVDMTVLQNRIAKMFWLLLDQGVFAVSNFVINILFARWLLPTEYGWWVMSFSLCGFLGTLHNSAVQEPVLVQAARIPKHQQRAYILALFCIHLYLLIGAVGLAGLGWSAAMVMKQPDLGWAMVGGFIGAIIMLTNIIGRRLCFIFVSARASTCVGVVYLVGSVLTAIVMHRLMPLWWFDIWLIIGGWSVFASIATFWLAHTRTVGDEPYSLSEVVAFCRHYAHWGLAASVFSWMRYDGLFVMLAHFAGLAEVAETRAVFNIGSPLLQVNMVVQTSALVSFSADSRRGSKQNILYIVGGYGLAMLLTLPILWYYSPWLVDLFYHGRYTNGAWQLPLYCLALGMSLLDAIVSGVFKASGNLWRGYTSVFLTGICSLVLGMLLIPVQHSLIFVMTLTSAIGLFCALILRMNSRT